MDIENFEEFLEFIDIVEEMPDIRLPKRYIRDAANPMEFYSEEDFRIRYRFSKNIIRDVIFPIVHPNFITFNNRGLPIPPIIQLLTTLRYYATGNFQLVSGDLRGLSQQSVSVIVKRVSEYIAETLPEHIHLPGTEEQKRQNVVMFHNISGFPGVAACLDCTHIKIVSPGGDNAEVFRNRKGFFSLNVQVAVGPQMEMLNIVVRHPGSAHDSVIFDRSSLRVHSERGDVGGLLLGDNGYPCRPYLLTPVIRPGNEHEERYNRAHIRTRNIVERVFGVWKRRFPCLYRGITTKLSTSQTVICATAVLYNISLKYKENFLDPAEFDIQNDLNLNVGNNGQLGLAFRNNFILTHF